MNTRGLSVLVVVATLALACKTTKGSALRAEDQDTAASAASTALDVATTRATCPFIGSAVATQILAVEQSPSRPLAEIDQVVSIGDTSENHDSDLGSKVLREFAIGNHRMMKTSDDSSTLDAKITDNGQFSLDFPGSQGSHPGHSRILEDVPTEIASGRFSAAEFSRLIALADNGHIKRSDVGKFIAGNLWRDKTSKVFGPRTAGLLKTDLKNFAGDVGRKFLAHFSSLVTGQSAPANPEERQLIVDLTKIAGEDNLIGSSGEFGLLFAFLRNSPETIMVDGEPALAVSDVTAMFQDKHFPKGWEIWRKTAHDWVVNSIGLAHAAAKEYILLAALGQDVAPEDQ